MQMGNQVIAVTQKALYLGHFRDLTNRINEKPGTIFFIYHWRKNQMKMLCKISILGASALLLTTLAGCTIDNTVPAAEGSEFSYSPGTLTTIALANRKPAEFPDSMSESEKIRHLFGYPLVSATPMGQFTASRAMTSGPESVQAYLNQMPTAKPPSGLRAEDMVTAGAGLGGLGIALLGGSAMTGGSGVGFDMREHTAVLCFVDSTKTPSAGDALLQCQDQLSEHLISALNATKQRTAGEGPLIYTGTIEVGGKKVPEVLYVSKRNSWYSAGFAPVDLGGYPAHIFKINFFTKGYIEEAEGYALVEDLAAALRKDKPANLKYRISARDDYRVRTGLEGLPVY